VTERWKKFEDAVAHELKCLSAKRPLVVHRFYDTRSAGSFLPNQPGDFLVIRSGEAFLLELKSSAVHTSLRSCLSETVSPQQIGHHKMWARAGAYCWFLFLGADGNLELWSSRVCITARGEGKPLKKNEVYGTYPSIHLLLEDLLG
jgi:hypothetical protein